MAADALPSDPVRRWRGVKTLTQREVNHTPCVQSKKTRAEARPRQGSKEEPRRDWSQQAKSCDTDH
eukprot:14333249-Alexandrium_andersonii.AAC.1